MKRNKQTEQQRAYETFCKSSKWLEEDRRDKKPLSREFKRVPYGLTVRKGK